MDTSLPGREWVVCDTAAHCTRQARSAILRHHEPVPARLPPLGAPRPLRAARTSAAALVVALVVAGCSSSGARPDALSISVLGNHFIDQNGTAVVLRGANTEGTMEDCAQPGAGFYADPTVRAANFPASTTDATTEIAAMKAWGINLVRVNLNEQCWLGINGVPSTTSQTSHDGTPYPVPAGDRYDRSVNAYMYEMGSYVHALNAAGIYAEVVLMLNAPGSELITGNPVTENPLPDSNSDRFWKSVASYFDLDGGVLFGVFNEPYPPNGEVNYDNATGWGCTLNGCTVPDYSRENARQYKSSAPSTSYAGEGMLQMIKDIREYDTSTPLVVAGPDFAGDMDQWLAYYFPNGTSIDPDNELAASVHIYFPVGSTACAASTDVTTACAGTDPGAVMQVAALAPVVADEVGDIDCGNKSLFPFLQSIDREDASGSVDIGYAGWSWTTYSCDPNLITNFTSGAPSTMGEAEYCELLDIGLAPRDNGRFDPSAYCQGTVPDASPR